MEIASSTRTVLHDRTTSMGLTTFAVGWSFFVMGLVLGNWAALIPAVAVIYELNDAVLGAILVPAVFGALCAAPIVSVVIMRYGSRIAVVSGCVVLIGLTIIIGIPSNIGVLIVGVVFLGFGMGWCDTSANHQAVICEKWAGTSKLGLFHAMYAIGGLVGVLYGGTLLQFNTPPLYVFIYLAAGTVVPTMIVVRWTFTHEEEKEIESRHSLARSEEEEAAVVRQQLVGIDGTAIDREIYLGDVEFTYGNGNGSGNGGDGGEEGGGSVGVNGQNNTAASRDGVMEFAAAEPGREDDKVMPKVPMDYSRIALVAGLGFLAYLGEGSVGDWSTVFLTNHLKAEPLIGTLGYAFFQLVVAIGRLSLDWLVTWIDRKRLLQVAGVVAAIGLGIVGLAPSLSEQNIIPGKSTVC